MTDSSEFKALIDCVPSLRIAVQANLISLSGELLAARIISVDKERALRNRNVDENERAADLVDSVVLKVQENPSENFGVFMKILHKDKKQFKVLIARLEESYHSHLASKATNGNIVYRSIAQTRKTPYSVLQ